jgi:hypothetical protein
MHWALHKAMADITGPDNYRKFDLLVDALAAAAQFVKALHESGYEPAESQFRSVLYLCEDISEHIYGGIQQTSDRRQLIEE